MGPRKPMWGRKKKLRGQMTAEGSAHRARDSPDKGGGPPSSPAILLPSGDTINERLVRKMTVDSCV